MLQLIDTYEYKTRISENADIIINGLQVVKKNIDSFRVEFTKLGDKLRLAQDNYNKADDSLRIVQKEVLKLEQNEKLEESNTIL